jgi:3-phosphoshikimate 1-carboxyvinyltransferase
MIACLQTLGVRIDAHPDTATIVVEGTGGNLASVEAELFCGNSGTTIRFCTALCALGPGTYTLDGNDRMRQRPIGPLVDALRCLGATVSYADVEGYPPVVVRGGTLRSGTVWFDSPQSSQFVSAILMAVPHALGDVFVEVTGSLVSVPYLKMTTGLMDAFGASVIEKIEPASARFVVPAPQRYTGRIHEVEPDASNASYFLAAPAVAGGGVTVEGLGTDSIQGDVRFVDVLEQMGCRVKRAPGQLRVEAPPAGRPLRGIDVDLNAMPDTAQTLAVVALFADGATTIRNVANLRIKETDRLAALATELARLGAEVELSDDAIIIHPPERPAPARVETYQDHRMAMSFALAGLAVHGVEILDPDCVNKTFPDFFQRFTELTVA